MLVLATLAVVAAVAVVQPLPTLLDGLWTGAGAQDGDGGAATVPTSPGDGGPGMLQGVPDAYVVRGGVILSGNRPGSISIAVCVWNAGNETASGYKVAAYDGDPGSGGTLIGSANLANIAQDAHVWGYITWPAAAGAQTLYIRLENTDAADPSANDFVTFVHNVLPNVVAFAGPDAVTDPGVNVTFNGSASYAVGSTIVNYTWDLGDGSPAAYGATPWHAYSNAGASVKMYTATLTVRDGYGRTASDTRDVYVNNASASKPTADAGPPPSGRTLDTLIFNGSASVGNIESYKWDFGDGGTASGSDTTHAYVEDGTFIVSLVVVNNLSAADGDVISVSVTNRPPVVSDIDDVVATVGVEQSFMALAYDQDGYLTDVQWDFGDGGKSTLSDTKHTWNRDGNHRVYLNVTDDDGATTSVMFWVNVTNVLPRPSFTHTPTSPREGDNFRVDASGSVEPGNDIVLYEWDWDGDGTYDNSSTAPTFTYVYYRPGAYNVTLRVTDGEATTNTTFRRVTVQNVAPTASATLTPTGENPEGTVLFFNASNSYEPGGNIIAYEWDFNWDNTIDLITTTPLVYHTFTQPSPGAGSQYARLRTRDEENTTSSLTYFASYRVSNVAPLVNLTVSSGVEGDLVVVRADVYEPGDDFTEFAWDFDGDDTVDVRTDVPFVNHTFWSAGNHSVWVMATDVDGTWGAGEVYVEVTDIPPAPRINEGLAVEGVPTVFEIDLVSSEENITEYAVDVDDDGEYDFTSSSPSITIVFTKVGMFRCRVRAIDTDGSDGYGMFQVTVADAPPVLTPGPLLIGAEGDPLRIEVTAYEPGMDITKYEYDWNADGTFDNTTDTPYAYHAFDTPGLKKVRVRATDIDNSTGMVEVRAFIANVGPVADAGTPPQGTEGQPVPLSAAGSYEPGDDIVRYEWDFDGDGRWDLETSLPTTNHTYDAPGTYNVWLRVTDEDGSFGVDKVPVQVVAVPPVARVTVTVMPEDRPSVLDGSSSHDPGGLASYTWTVSSFGQTVTETTTMPLFHFVFDRKVDYTVTLKVTDTDAPEPGTAEVTVTVDKADVVTVPPAAQWTLPVEPQEGQLATFSVSATDPFPAGTTLVQAIEYEWDFGDGTKQAGATVAHSFVASGAPYSIRLTVTDEDNDKTVLTGNVTVRNVMPVVTPPGPIIVRAGGEEETSITATDLTPGGLTLHLAEGSPEWVSVDGMKVLAKPGSSVDAGTYLVTVRVRDAAGGETDTIVAVLVTKMEVAGVTWGGMLAVVIPLLIVFLAIAIVVAKRMQPPPPPPPRDRDRDSEGRDYEAQAVLRKRPEKPMARVEPERVDYEMEPEAGPDYGAPPAYEVPPPPPEPEPPSSGGFELEMEVGEDYVEAHEQVSTAPPPAPPEWAGRREPLEGDEYRYRGQGTGARPKYKGAGPPRS